MSTKTYSKLSFDRFGDDMCELVLSYLSLEDRHRLECVSPQFQRCIYQTIYDYTIDETLFIKLRKTSALGAETTDANKFKTFIKKLAQIRKLIVKYNTFWCRFGQLVLMLDHAVKHCPDLSAIECHFVHITDDKANRLFARFADKLTAIVIYIQENVYRGRVFSINNVRLCTRLRELNVVFLAIVFHGRNNCLVRDLRDITFCYTTSDQQLLSAFMASNSQTLESVSVYLTRHVDLAAVADLLSRLSHVPNLRRLKLNFLDYYPVHTLCESLTAIAANCPLLDTLRLKLFAEAIEQNIQVFEIIKLFTGIRRLDISLYTGYAPDEPVYLSTRSLAECRSLTHLTIKANQYAIGDEFFDSIGRHLPRLRYLNAWNANVSEQVFVWLAGLRELRELHLSTYVPKQIDEHCVQDLLRRCPHLKVVDLENFETVDDTDFDDNQVVIDY